MTFNIASLGFGMKLNIKKRARHLEQLMKNKLVILFLLIYNLCPGQNDLDFSKLSVTESRVDSINIYFDKVLKSHPKEKENYERLFFELLPNSHNEMSDAMYIDYMKKHADWEKNKYKKGYVYKLYAINPWVEYLSTIDYYDKDAYYEKYFNICIGGEYAADYLQLGFEIYKRFLNDTKTACQKMDKLDDEKIESIFSFIFDEPHPKLNEESIALYNEMLSKIKQVNLRLSKLLEQSYKRILEKRSKH